MATETLTPAAPKPDAQQPQPPSVKPPLPPGDIDRPTGKLVPALLLAALIAGLAYAVYAVISYVNNIPVAPGQDLRFLFRRLEDVAKPFGDMGSGAGWALLLTSAGLASLIGWVGWRRLRAGESVHYLLTIPFVVLVTAVLYCVVSLLFLSAGKEASGKLFWLPVITVVLIVAFVYAIWMYVRDAAAVGWLWATFLGVIRCSVYLILASIFLLPAIQAYEKSEQFSRVLVLVDLSGSMNVSDEFDAEGNPGLTRLQHVNKLLTEDNGGFITRLQDKNPVFLYRFGGTLDPEFKEFRKGEQPWSTDEWTAWMRMDLRQWVLTGLSERGRPAIADSDAFKSDKISAPDQWAADWFKNHMRRAAEGLGDEDRQRLDDKAKALNAKLEMMQQIRNSTNLSDSLLAALMREGNNMLAGVVVITDGRSTNYSETTFQEARRRAEAAKVPVFTVGVGTVLEKKEIRITDLIAPSRTPPDDPFMVRATVQGEGLADQKFEAYLDVYAPNAVLGKDKPVMVIKANPEGNFKTGGPVPVGQVEFLLDPGDLKKKEFDVIRARAKDKAEYLKEFNPGEYKLILRVPKAKGEIFKGKEHASDLPVLVNIEKRPLRVLIASGGPTKDSQFVRRLLMNERLKGRADFSVYQQVTDLKGPRYLDVPDEQLLKKFPDEFRTDLEAKDIDPKLKWYNLALYDVVLAFDLDWTKVDKKEVDNLQKWVTERGGGLVVVAGINTSKLTETLHKETLNGLLTMLPVELADDREATYIDSPTDKPVALKFPTIPGDTDFMKIDEAGKDDRAGWAEFFYGVPADKVDKNSIVQRGFHRCYPSKKVKGQAVTLATCPRQVFNQGTYTTEDHPYIVTFPYGGGRSVFLGGEMWRLRHAKNGEQYYERFWTKLARYAGAEALKRESKNRGMIVVTRRAKSGDRDRTRYPNAKLWDKAQNPIPDSSEPRYSIYRTDSEVNKPVASGKFVAKKEAKGWFAPTSFEFPTVPGKYEIRLEVPGGGAEELREEFYVIESNPEVDDTRPDFARLLEVASPLSEVRVTEASQLNRLREALKASGGDRTTGAPAAKDAADPKLFFNLRNARLIPEYLKTDRKEFNNRGKIEDLWSEGPSISSYDGKPMIVGTALLIIVGLLSIEWLTRKLLRLA